MISVFFFLFFLFFGLVTEALCYSGCGKTEPAQGVRELKGGQENVTES